MRLNTLYASITSNSQKAGILFSILILISLGLLVLLTKKFPQLPNYHNFADDRTVLGILNFWNVISNIPFLLVSILGFVSLRKAWSTNKIRAQEAVVFFILFLGVLLISLGSTYYHLAPDSNRLVWDRIPMTIVFMSLLSFTIMERINFNLGLGLFIPFIAFGVFSVLYWHQTELAGQGDIRLYALVQFYSIFLIMLTLILFPKPYPPFKIYLWMFVFYGLAKITEHFDLAIYEFSGLISGHTLKHIFAAISIYFAVVFLNIKSLSGSCNHSQ
ncbi:hypothetical protein [uncultured Legionella sp.]|uniref:ceramidase domain-containing protein n=1 Tax=uncultured Legionella sp. TaxID=210934 RepID=UPI00262AB6EA|nr:hypothetical protein [uncultured Legionella sp.]